MPVPATAPEVVGGVLGDLVGEGDAVLRATGELDAHS